jgi:hypothetical protein
VKSSICGADGGAGVNGDLGRALGLLEEGKNIDFKLMAEYLDYLSKFTFSVFYGLVRA